MREYRSYGSVRGAPGDRRLYRDRLWLASGCVAFVLRNSEERIGVPAKEEPSPQCIDHQLTVNSAAECR